MKGYPTGIVGMLFKKFLLISEAFEGIFVYSITDLAF